MEPKNKNALERKDATKNNKVNSPVNKKTNEMSLSNTSQVEKIKLTCCGKTKIFLSNYWKSIVIITVPILLLPIILLNEGKEFRCMYVVALMSSFWVTEALPLPVTSMIPMILFPLFEIMSTGQTTMQYMKEAVVMFIGGIIMALAVEFCNLHKRVALRFILLLGCSPRRLHLGLTLVTMFISMWISNTAAVAMMCPIMHAVLEELSSQGLCKMYEESQISVEDARPNEPEVKKPSKITTCYFLAAAYAASIGGCGTIIGSGTNLTFKGIYDGLFTDSDGVNFSSWMIYNIPVMLVNTILMWCYLQWLFMGMWRPNSEAAKEANIGKEGAEIATQVIKTKYIDLGSMSSHEIWVGLFFCVGVLLFFTRSPGFMPGWTDNIHPQVKDGTPAILIVILLFIFPAKWTILSFFRTSDYSELPKKSSQSLITWTYVNSKTPWSLIFLLGGGFALAEGGKVSGMNALIGKSLVQFGSLPPYALLFCTCLAAGIFTEFTSNVAVANILLPVLAELSINIKLHPLYLMMPAAIMCSMAFHMPVGTPPNAIVAGYMNIQMKDMAIGGIGPSIITLIVIAGSFPTWGAIIYPDLDTFPSWAHN